MADKSKDFAIVKIKHLARQSRIPYYKLDNCINGRYSTLTPQEKTHLYNVLRDEVEKATLWLGFTFDGRPIKPK